MLWSCDKEGNGVSFKMQKRRVLQKQEKFHRPSALVSRGKCVVQKRKVGNSCKSWSLVSVLIFFSSLSRFNLASLRRATADVADCDGCGIEGKEGKPESGSVLMAAGSDLIGTI